jgi:transcriptional regulator GlxA family with amidase domain
MICKKDNMINITFLAMEGSLLSGISGPMDTFSIANLWQKVLHKDAAGPLFDSKVVTCDGRAVRAHGGLLIQPDGSIDDVDKTDMIFMPPLLPNLYDTPDPSDPTLEWIRSHYQQDARIGAICTGAFVLAETGLLDGKIATTNWQYARMFHRRYPKVNLHPERILTDDSGLICSGAATASFNMGLHIIEIFGGTELASVCAKALLVDPKRDSQSPYIILDFPRNHGDTEILQAQSWMEANYAENMVIDDIAKYVSISPRHFKRRFKNATGVTPSGYLQRVRIEAAKKKLEYTAASMDEITWQIGYENSSSFRRLFKKYIGLSPREYRDKFSRADNRSITSFV